MKAFFESRAASWIIPIVGIVVLALLIWFFGPFIAIADWVPLGGVIARVVAIVVVVLVWALNRFRKYHKAKKADQGLAYEIVSSEDAAADHAALQSAEEVEVLRERFEDAVGLLRKRSDRRGALSLYELPWYIIIGPPGSGKTTALVNSGLRFPLEQRYGKEALRGVGGTRNCDWWFTDDAVLLDTAGRYLTQDSHEAVDKSAWQGFLDLLKKYRKRQPINGVLVAVSISDLLLQSEADRKAQVLAIRSRVQELYKHFGIRFPVYMLFTKCDLIAGFTEYFDDLDVEGRQQILGMTFPFSDTVNKDSDDVDRFDAEFDLILQRINARLLWRLSQERDTHRSARIFGFPQQLSDLRTTLMTFLGDVFRSSRYDTPVLLRGVYFTSGTQEGTPIDRLMSVMARTFGMTEQAVASTGGQGRSYFITDLFRKVVFAESGVAGTNRRVENRLRWLQNGAFVGAVAIAAGLALAWLTSFRSNQAFIGEVATAVENYDRVAADIPDASSPDALLPRLNALATVGSVAGQHEPDVPLHMRMWLYQGESLSEHVHDAYLRELNQTLAPPMLGEIASGIRESAGEPQLLYEYLKAYLMLGNPERLDASQLSYLVGSQWQRGYGAGAVAENLTTHSDYLIRHGAQPHPINERLVEAARATLAQAPLSDFLYSRLKLDALEYEDADILLRTRLGLSADQVFTRKSGASLDARIPALFTRTGFEEIYPALSAQLLVEAGKENWVLGREDAGIGVREKIELQAGLREQYEREYREFWSGLLADFEIVPFSDATSGIETLSLISGNPSVLQEFLELVAENTDLAGGSIAETAGQVLDAAETAASATRSSRLSRLLPGGERVADAAAEARRPGDAITEEFERINRVVVTSDGQPGEINQLLLLVGDLRDEIESTGRGIGQTNALDTLTSGGSPAANQIRSAARRQPEPLRSWLLQIGGGSGAITAGSARSALGEKIRQDVVTQCQSLISGRYPFVRNSKQDVTIDDFGRVFGYGGILERFFDENLAPLVDRSGSSWRWRDGGDASLRASNRVLQQFQRAARIREAYFPPGSQRPEMSMTMIPVSLDADVTRFVLEVDDNLYEYRHGPAREWNITWPSNTFGKARVMFEEASGGRPIVVEEGPWSLFRLLDGSRLTARSASEYDLELAAGGRTAGLLVRMRSVRNPLSVREVEGFVCPSGL